MSPLKTIAICSILSGLVACASPTLPSTQMNGVMVGEDGEYLYRIGTNDIISVFVWGNPDISRDYAVRPDGKISMALTGALEVAGLSSKQVEEKLADSLTQYLKNPKVTVMLQSAAGNVTERIKIVGDAVTPSSQPYRYGMTLMDLMIQAGGLSTYADGNDAVLIRIVDGELIEYELRVADLMKDADMSANIDLLPGDVIRIPEAWF